MLFCKLLFEFWISKFSIALVKFGFLITSLIMTTWIIQIWQIRYCFFMSIVKISFVLILDKDIFLSDNWLTILGNDGFQLVSSIDLWVEVFLYDLFSSDSFLWFIFSFIIGSYMIVLFLSRIKEVFQQYNNNYID